MYSDKKLEDSDDVDSENEQKDSDDEIIKKKNRNKNKKNASNNRSAKDKSSKKHKNTSDSKSSKTNTTKKSRAIIDDDDDDDDFTGAATSLGISSINDLKSNLDDDDDEEDEDDVDEEAVKEEFNDFIDDNVDDEEEEDEDKSSEKSSSEESNQKKHKKDEKKIKKKKKDKKSKKKKKGSNESGSSSSNGSEDDATDLEDDDLDLLKDNLNVDDLEDIGIAKKRRRIHIASESSEEEKEKNETDQEKTFKDKKKSKSQRQGSPKYREEDENNGKNLSYDNEQESDEESFIVDDTDEEAENKIGSDDDNNKTNRRIEKDSGKQKKKRAYNDEAQQEALDIFGVNAEELGAISDESGEEDEEDYEEDLEEEFEEEDDEAEVEEEDDITQKAVKKRQKQRRLKVMHKIEDIFEPQELEKNLLTEFDQQIRIEDKPERFMLRTLPVTTEPNDSELEKEAEWIFNQGFQFKKTISSQVTTEPKPFSAVQKIKDTLNFIRNEFLEIPFIAFYRKEYFQPELTIPDLWKVYELDEKYCQLKLRKENLLKLYDRMKNYQTEELIPSLEKKRYKRVLLNDDDDEATLVEDDTIINQIESMRLLTDEELNRIRSIQTIDEFLDNYHHFHLHYSNDLIAMKEYELKETIKASKLRNAAENPDEADTLADIDLDIDILDGAKFMKYASRKDRLFYCKQAGLEKLAREFGLTSKQFGENLLADYQKHEIDQSETDPLQLANQYVKEPFFQTSDQVLNTVKYMMSIQLARDPIVRQYVRELYMQNACLNVRPTVPRGFKEIDESHNCFPLKYLKQKPCIDLKQDEYLKLAHAEQDNLITIKFDTLMIKQIVVDQNKIDSEKSSGYTTYTRSIIEKLKTFYQKDEFSYNVEQWNIQRAQVIEDMCNKFLFPDFEKELRSKLLYEAKQFVFKECAKRLNSYLNQAPLKPFNDDDSSKSGHLDFNENGLSLISIAFTTNEMDENGGNNLASVAVATYVNGAGNLDEFIRIRNFNLKINSNSYQNSKRSEYLTKEKEEKIEDLSKLEEFIIKKQPKLIIINSENKDALILQDDVKTIVNSILEKHDTKMESIRIEIVDNELAKLYESSKLSEQELGTNVPALVKQSIALARYVQDPLLCFSQFFNQERDILGYKFHSMQPTLLSMSGNGRQSDDASELLRLLEIEFVNKVNEVGVDLNRCSQCPHTSHCLQFVSGLGPRKAQHIIKVLRHQRSQQASTLTQDKQISTYPVAVNRLFLVTKCTLGRRVFINCAGFIKFDVDSICKEVDENENDESKYTEILDSTRIHPETYDWARKMAVDALDIEETENETNHNLALKEILENPKKLKDLDLDAFAAELIRTGHGVKNLTLYDIRKELMFRYKDLRSDFITLSNEEKFYSLIKETPQSFHVGKLVLCRCVGIARRRPNKEQLDEANPIKDDNTCMWQCSFCKRNDFNELSQIWSHFDTGECPGPPVGVRTMLDNGCNGFIPLKSLSDSQVSNPEDRIKVGMTIHSRLTRIDPERFSVELTCKTSDLRDLNDKWKPAKDEYYDHKTQDEDQFKLDEKKKKEEHRQTYTKRIIAHPQFKNIGYSQAIVYLKDMGIGDAIIRPSSKGNDHLTVTWKINKNCYQHVDILEEKKQNSFSIGKRLIIDGEDYEDLDEILARYISPMANCAREIVNHKNYKELEIINAYNMQTPADEDEQNNNNQLVAKNDRVEVFLLDERSKNPSKIPYMFTCCRNLPGRFMISYMVKTKLRNEYIKITQDGFKFREKPFNSFNELLNWFKAHYNDPLSFEPNKPQSNSINSTQKISSQLDDMSLTNQQQKNIRTPNYQSSTRTPLHQANTYDSIETMPINSYTNQYALSATGNVQSFNENEKIEYSTNNNKSFSNDRGTNSGYHRSSRFDPAYESNKRGGDNRRGGFNRNRGGGARGGGTGSNYNDWDSNGQSDFNQAPPNNFNRFNNINNRYNNSSNNNNDEDWNNQYSSQSFNQSSSQNRYNSRSNFEENRSEDSKLYNRNQQTANNNYRTPQQRYNNFNRFNNNNNSANRNVASNEDWDEN